MTGRLIFAWMAYWLAARLTVWPYSQLDSKNAYRLAVDARLTTCLASWLATIMSSLLND